MYTDIREKYFQVWYFLTVCQAMSPNKFNDDIVNTDEIVTQ